MIFTDFNYLQYYYRGATLYMTYSSQDENETALYLECAFKTDFNSLFMALSIGGFVWDLVDVLDTVVGVLFHLKNWNILNIYKVIYQNVDNTGFKLMFYELFLNTKQNKHFKVFVKMTYTKDVKLNHCQESNHSTD